MTLWFKIHVLVSLAILISDARGTLEPTVKKWEEKLGIPVYYAPNDSMDVEISNPYPIQYVPQQDTFNSQRQNDANR
jgi:hypothetical protein